MTEQEIDKAHEVWDLLYRLLRNTANTVIDAAQLTPDQEDYVMTKLHEELRYWK